MNKEEWEKFWEFVLKRSGNNEQWSLYQWLKKEKEEYEKRKRR